MSPPLRYYVCKPSKALSHNRGVPVYTIVICFVTLRQAARCTLSRAAGVDSLVFKAPLGSHGRGDSVYLSKIKGLLVDIGADLLIMEKLKEHSSSEFTDTGYQA